MMGRITILQWNLEKTMTIERKTTTTRMGVEGKRSGEEEEEEVIKGGISWTRTGD